MELGRIFHLDFELDISRGCKIIPGIDTRISLARISLNAFDKTNRRDGFPPYRWYKLLLKDFFPHRDGRRRRTTAKGYGDGQTYESITDERIKR